MLTPLLQNSEMGKGGQLDDARTLLSCVHGHCRHTYMLVMRSPDLRGASALRAYVGEEHDDARAGHVLGRAKAKNKAFLPAAMLCARIYASTKGSFVPVSKKRSR